jgi:hypothetical protein
LENWNKIDGYEIVDLKYCIDESLPALYEEVDGTYEITGDTTIVEGKTYYAPIYKNPKYAGL